MEIIKKTDEYFIVKKRSGRYGVRRPSGHWVNGEEKVEILRKEGLISAPEPKPEEAPADEIVEAPGDEPAEQETSSAEAAQ